MTFILANCVNVTFALITAQMEGNENKGYVPKWSPFDPFWKECSSINLDEIVS